MSDTAGLLWKIISPVFIMLGTLGNVLCITVLSRPGNRKSSTAVFMMALAVSDLIVIYTGLLRWWLIHLIDVDVRHLGTFGCRIHWFLIFASTETSSWILVAVTCERIISTKWPHKVRSLCTPRSAVYVVVTMTLIIYTGSTHLLYGMDLRLVEHAKEAVPTLRDGCAMKVKEFENSSVACNCSDTTLENKSASLYDEGVQDMTNYACAAFSSEGYRHFFNFVYPWLDLITYFLIPAVILCIGDVIIIHKIISSRKLRLSMMLAAQLQSRQISDKSLSITIMLLTVNAVFILCTTPVSVYLIGMPYWVDKKHGFTEDQEIAWAAVNLLMYLNHSINFLLYFLSGTRFRQKVYDTMKCRKSGKSYSSSSNNSQPGSVRKRENRAVGVCKDGSGGVHRCSTKQSTLSDEDGNDTKDLPDGSVDIKLEMSDSPLCLATMHNNLDTPFISGVKLDGICETSTKHLKDTEALDSPNSRVNYADDLGDHVTNVDDTIRETDHDMFVTGTNDLSDHGASSGDIDELIHFEGSVKSMVNQGFASTSHI